MVGSLGVPIFKVNTALHKMTDKSVLFNCTKIHAMPF